MSYLPVLSSLPLPGTAEPEKAANSQCRLQVDLAAGAHSSLWHKHNQTVPFARGLCIVQVLAFPGRVLTHLASLPQPAHVLSLL